MPRSTQRDRQTWIESWIETATNVSTGFVVSFLVWVFVVPMIYPELDKGPRVAVGVTVIFTVASVLRQLVWRRFFENDFHKVAKVWALRIKLALFSRTL